MLVPYGSRFYGILLQPFTLSLVTFRFTCVDKLIISSKYKNTAQMTKNPHRIIGCLLNALVQKDRCCGQFIRTLISI